MYDNVASWKTTVQGVETTFKVIGLQRCLFTSIYMLFKNVGGGRAVPSGPTYFDALVVSNFYNHSHLSDHNCDLDAFGIR